MTTDYKPHPLANLFPMMGEAELAELTEDIRKNGCQVRGLIHEGKILDGRNRYEACKRAGQEMSWSEIELSDWPDFDPLSYVISANLHRRHLTTAQRAIIGARLAKLKWGGDRKSEGIKPSIDGLNTEDAAQLLNTSTKSIERAREVIRDAHPSVVQLVEQGELSVNAASKFAKATPDKKEQAAIAKQGAGAVKKSAGNGQAAKPAGRQSAGRADDRKTSTEASEFVELFRRQKERLVALRQVWDELEAHELAVVQAWIRGD